MSSPESYIQNFKCDLTVSGERLVLKCALIWIKIYIELWLILQLLRRLLSRRQPRRHDDKAGGGDLISARLQVSFVNAVLYD